MHIIL